MLGSCESVLATDESLIRACLFRAGLYCAKELASSLESVLVMVEDLRCAVLCRALEFKSPCESVLVIHSGL